MIPAINNSSFLPEASDKSATVWTISNDFLKSLSYSSANREPFEQILRQQDPKQLQEAAVALSWRREKKYDGSPNRSGSESVKYYMTFAPKNCLEGANKLLDYLRLAEQHYAGNYSNPELKEISADKNRLDFLREQIVARITAQINFNREDCTLERLNSYFKEPWVEAFKDFPHVQQNFVTPLTNQINDLYAKTKLA